MKKIYLILLTFLITGCLVSCRKKEPRLGGRVITVRGGDLVPHARVVFLGAEGANNLFSTSSFNPLGETVSDALGHFEIPDNDDIRFIMALPPNEEDYTDYAWPFGTETYFSEGGIFECRVEAASWVRVTSLDVEPLDSDVSMVELGTDNQYGLNISEGHEYYWKTGSDKAVRLYGRIRRSGIVSEYFEIDLPPLAAYDTVNYVFEY